MMKKFLAVLVLGLAMFAISCSGITDPLAGEFSDLSGMTQYSMSYDYLEYQKEVMGYKDKEEEWNELLKSEGLDGITKYEYTKIVYYKEGALNISSYCTMEGTEKGKNETYTYNDENVQEFIYEYTLTKVDDPTIKRSYYDETSKEDKEEAVSDLNGFTLYKGEGTYKGREYSFNEEKMSDWSDEREREYYFLIKVSGSNLYMINVSERTDATTTYYSYNSDNYGTLASPSDDTTYKK